MGFHNVSYPYPCLQEPEAGLVRGVRTGEVVRLDGARVAGIEVRVAEAAPGAARHGLHGVGHAGRGVFAIN